MNGPPSDPLDALEPAVRRMIDATNADDSTAFLEQFAAHAVVDDWGRRFAGRTQIAIWNGRENIGTHNRIRVTGVRAAARGVEVLVEVSGNGYNGPGTFAIELQGGLIARMVIRG